MRQHHHHQPPTLVAILGTHTLAEDILGRLLEHEGYDVRHLQAHPTERVEDLLDDVDILLLAPGLEGEVREGFLKVMKSTPKTAAIPVLPLSSALKMALLDEISAGAPWRGLFEELVGEIGAALQRAAASAGALLVEGSGAEPPGPVSQADAAL
jgi:hypothetical protein